MGGGESGDRQEGGGGRVGIDTDEWGARGREWIGVTGRGGGEWRQTGGVGWEGERVGIDRGMRGREWG